MNLGEITISGTVLEVIRERELLVVKATKISADINGTSPVKNLDEPETVILSWDDRFLKSHGEGVNMPDNDCDAVYVGDCVSVTILDGKMIELVNHTCHYGFMELISRNLKVSF